jgi:hypothetical protein
MEKSMKNSGHRLGASGTNLENTIQGLRNSIDNLDEKKFRYWEFDIRESIDGVVFVFHDDMDTGMFNVNPNILGFSTAGSERMRVDASGNVGIGTTSPSAKLHVAGTSFFFDQANFDDKVGIGTANPNAKLEIVQSNNADALRIRDGANTLVANINIPTGGGAALQLKNVAGSTTIELDARANGDIYFNTGGNVGIGTTDP